ncbi:VOC family protein [Micromonospora zamorensis]|uniref:VOC family protein n=1 Tax=Micromonospora zamorensis TaxID=709883 RepID=UPI003D9679F1
MIIGIDHIGLASDDPDALAGPLTALGLARSDSGVAAGYQVGCEFWNDPARPGAPAVEVVAPLTPESAIAHHLAARGPGLYHVAFRVDDLAGEVARLRREGFVPVDDRPHDGARPGMRVQFLYLRRPAGLLVELVEYTAAG